MNRPTEEQKQAAAKSIREGGGAALELMTEESLGQGIISGGTPILDEAAIEEAEGGGPVAEAVAEFDAKNGGTNGVD